MAEPIPLQLVAPVEAEPTMRDTADELQRVEEALTYAWMFLNAVIVFLMQVCRQRCAACHCVVTAMPGIQYAAVVMNALSRPRFRLLQTRDA